MTKPSEDVPGPFPEINKEECKACGRCVLACPKKVLRLGDELNDRGFRYVTYSGKGCVGCGNCFYTCPEPYTFKIHIPEKKKAQE